MFVSLLSMVQSSVVWMGLAGGLVVCTVGAARGELSVGDTVLFISLMSQLYGPLTVIGSYYRQVRPAWGGPRHLQPPRCAGLMTPMPPPSLPGVQGAGGCGEHV